MKNIDCLTRNNVGWVRFFYAVKKRNPTF